MNGSLSGESERVGRRILILSMALVLGLLAGRTRVHNCEGDAQLYRVVARNLAERGEWLSLSYLPSVHPVFREHLPFGLWPTAAAIRWLGEGALPWLDGAWSAAILFAMAAVARRLWSDDAAAGATLVLGLTDNFSLYCAFPRLDGPTVLFGFLAAVPWLQERPIRTKGWAGSVLSAAVACAVKGPFGLVPLLAVGGARLLSRRSWRTALGVAGAALLAALPVAFFLCWQRSHGDSTWWEGYVRSQLLASSTGARNDGHGGWLYPVQVLWRHFWPGLAVLPFAIWALREREVARRLLALATLLGLVALALPQRKLAHHVVVLYPLMALLTGERLGVALRRICSRWRSVPSMSALVTFAIWILVILGRPLWFRPRHCLSTGALSPTLAALPSGTEVWMVKTPVDWPAVAALAADLRITSWPVDRWEALDESSGAEKRYALSREEDRESPPSWKEVAQGDGWRLWTR